MSELAVCNFCRLRQIRLGLGLFEQIVLVHDGEKKAAESTDWIGCYVIPDSLELEAFDNLPADEKKPYWRCSFGSVPTHCIC